MSDVTTIQVVPDTTYVIVDEDETTILVDGDTYLDVQIDGTNVLYEQDITQISLEDTETVVLSVDETKIVSTGAAGPQGPPGPPGPAGGTDTLVTTAEAIGAGRVVTLLPDGAHYYDPTVPNYGKAVGVSKHAAAAGADLAIALIGPVSLIGAGYTPGTRFWAATNGMLTSTPPVTGVVVPVGYAVDADTLFVQFESYLEW